MKIASKKYHRTHRNLPAIVAVGGSLAALPAAALELGEINVQSRLGQPLRASIAYALAPNEQISRSCVSLRQGSGGSGLPNVGSATLSVSNGVISLAGSSAMREPMVSAHVVVNCPYSPKLSREYMLFIDPVTPVHEAARTTPQIEPAAEPVTASLAAAPVAREVAPRPAIRKDIGPASDYRVQPGDSLSAIASRIENRPVGLWPAVNAIFDANPHAFMNNDPNQLKAGSLLSIPSFDGSAAVVTATVFEPIAEAEIVEAETPAPFESATPIVSSDVAETSLVETTEDLQPGDIVVSDNPFVAPIASSENLTIPDTQLEGPTTSSSSPNVPTAIIRTSDSASSGAATPSWILWLAGSGVALIIGLLMFGRRFRGEPEMPLAPVAEPMPRRRVTDLETSDTESLESIGVDYDLTDDSPTEENLALDADVVIGTGLDVGEESAVAEDFGFAPGAEVDIELPFEPVAQVTDETDVLPPMHTDEHSILMKEVLPDDDDYDMSVIVDATKMPQPDDVTERDLQAVAVETDDETLMTSGYTIDKEVDYQVLEQDYEDELTATQALNEEISRAAAELAERMDVEIVDSEETTAMPLASVTELDITAQMPAQNDDDSSLDDTGINEEITINEAADDSTVEMPQSKKAR